MRHDLGSGGEKLPPVVPGYVYLADELETGVFDQRGGAEGLVAPPRPPAVLGDAPQPATDGLERLVQRRAVAIMGLVERARDVTGRVRLSPVGLLDSISSNHSLLPPFPGSSSLTGQAFPAGRMPSGCPEWSPGPRISVFKTTWPGWIERGARVVLVPEVVQAFAATCRAVAAAERGTAARRTSKTRSARPKQE